MAYPGFAPFDSVGPKLSKGPGGQGGNAWNRGELCSRATSKPKKR